MPPTAARPDHRPGFVVGITGHMDLREEELEPLREKIKLIFRFLKHGFNGGGQGGPSLKDKLEPLFGDPKTIEALADWEGLADTPIVVLSSLAPGADTLAAEAALEEEFQKLGFSVRAPLPFPSGLYINSCTFVRAPGGSSDPTLAAGDRRRQADFRRLIKAIGCNAAFPVELAEERKMKEAERIALRRSDVLRFLATFRGWDID